MPAEEGLKQLLIKATNSQCITSFIKFSRRQIRSGLNALSRFSVEELKEMYEWHALQDNWYQLDYLDFLTERRKKIAQVIRKGFETLT